jgi:hypothetical protein
MAQVADHLSVSALEQQYRSCPDATASRHLQAIWLLAKGPAIAEVAATVSYARRWVERLLATTPRVCRLWATCADKTAGALPF